MKTREEEIAEIPLVRSDRSQWPPGVRTIAIDETDGFGVDATGVLHWHGKPVEIRRPLELSRWQSILGGLAAASAVVMAVFDGLRFFGYGIR